MLKQFFRRNMKSVGKYASVETNKWWHTARTCPNTCCAIHLSDAATCTMDHSSACDFLLNAVLDRLNVDPIMGRSGSRSGIISEEPAAGTLEGSTPSRSTNPSPAQARGSQWSTRHARTGLTCSATLSQVHRDVLILGIAQQTDGFKASIHWRARLHPHTPAHTSLECYRGTRDNAALKRTSAGTALANRFSCLCNAGKHNHRHIIMITAMGHARRCTASRSPDRRTCSHSTLAVQQISLVHLGYRPFAGPPTHHKSGGIITVSATENNMRNAFYKSEYRSCSTKRSLATATPCLS